MKKLLIVLGIVVPLFAQNKTPQAVSFTEQEIVCRTNTVQVTILDGVTNRTVLRSRGPEQRPDFGRRPFPPNRTNQTARPVGVRPSTPR